MAQNLFSYHSFSPIHHGKSKEKKLKVTLTYEHMLLLWEALCLIKAGRINAPPFRYVLF